MKILSLMTIQWPFQLPCRRLGTRIIRFKEMVFMEVPLLQTVVVLADQLVSTLSSNKWCNNSSICKNNNSNNLWTNKQQLQLKRNRLLNSSNRLKWLHSKINRRKWLLRKNSFSSSNFYNKDNKWCNSNKLRVSRWWGSKQRRGMITTNRHQLNFSKCLTNTQHKLGDNHQRPLHHWVEQCKISLTMVVRSYQVKQLGIHKIIHLINCNNY